MRIDSEIFISFIIVWGLNVKKIFIKEVIRFIISDLNF